MKRIIVQNLFGGDPAGRDRQAIERNVPNQLAPAFLHQIINHPAGHAALLEFPDNSASALLGRTGEFTDGQVSIIKMLNQTRRNAVKANKTKPAHHSIGAEMSSKKILIP